jgi:two-component system nitrogen regulation response regulator GlnG
MNKETQPTPDLSNKTEVGLAYLVENQLARYINADRQVLPASGLYDRVMNEVERPLLRLVLGLVNGNKIQAAKVLGMNRNTLLKKLRIHGLEPVSKQKTSTKREVA